MNPTSSYGKTKFEVTDLGYGEGEEITFEKRSQNNRKEMRISIRDKNNNTYESIYIPWKFAEELASFITDGPRPSHGKSKISEDPTELVQQMREIRTAFSMLKSSVNKVDSIISQHKLEAEVKRQNKLPEAKRREYDF